MTSLQQTAMLGGDTTAKTASYVLVAADAGTTVAMDAAGATTITVNTGLFAAGDTVFIQNRGAGVCTVTAGTATVACAGSLALPQNDAGILYFTSASAATFYDFIQVGATSPLTTKGDIYVYGSSDTRLPVGSNDQTLVADSSTATGLKWATASSADPFLTPEVSGYYVKRSQTGTADNNTIIPITTTFYFPVFLPTASYDRISMRSGAYVGTATVRMGLYNASSTTGLPTTVVFDAGTVSPSVIDTNYEITISQSLSAGYYYMALNLQAKTGDGDYITGGALPTPGLPFLITATSFGTGVGFNYFTQSGVSGAFATAGSLTASSSSSCPMIGMRIA